VFVQGAAKVSGRKGEIQVDLNFTTVKALGSALMHHTGSKRFNIMCRSRHGDAYGTVSSTVAALDRRLGVSRYLHRPGSLYHLHGGPDVCRTVTGAASRSSA
jgi:hypothetical protein